MVQLLLLLHHPGPRLRAGYLFLWSQIFSTGITDQPSGATSYWHGTATRHHRRPVLPSEHCHSYWECAYWAAVSSGPPFHRVSALPLTRITGGRNSPTLSILPSVMAHGFLQEQLSTDPGFEPGPSSLVAADLTTVLRGAPFIILIYILKEVSLLPFFS